MNNELSFTDRLRPIISPIIGTLVGSFSAWLYRRYCFEIDSATQDAITLVIFGLITSIVNKVVARWTNPGNMAHPRLAAEVVNRVKAAKLPKDEIKNNGFVPGQE